MAKLKVSGSASGTGTITLIAPATSTDRTITLPDESITLGGGVDGITSSADATAITIDSNEQVTMGGTTLYAGQGNTATGQHFENTGTGYLSRTGGYALGLNRNTSDGTLINFARQGSSVGSIDVSTSGVSIKLGGTATANALDDYETGTWTPSLQVYPSGVTLGTVDTANYTKIGDRVFITLTCLILSSSSPAPGNDMRITGFPFSFADAAVAYPARLNYNYKETPQLMMNGAGYFYFQSTTVGGNNQSPIGSGLDGSNRLSVVITYKTNA
jgi:hypothetical protein